ncbi:MAG: TonB-dependent receptor domain-containing protein [Candidatus Acidiferrales bacterium]
MKAGWKSILSLLFLIACCASVSLAQTAETGALAGSVLDPTGGLVAEANVEVTNEATGQIRTAVSQANGRYIVALLPTGTYRVAVKKTGFKENVENGIHVDVVGTTQLDIVMELGELSEKITVEATPSMTNTESSTLGRVVNQQAIEGLPLVTRNYTQIIGLSPGIEAPVTNATELGRGSGGVSPTQTTAGLFVHGARSYDNNFQMNGISVNDNEATGGSSGGIPIPNSDTLAEFEVQTGLYDAAFGHNAGANVDVVTKGGSNDFHGSVFEFFRNEVLNANDYFFNQTGQPRPILRQNQFGFTLGGPIRKNKLLFFGSYQATRQLNGASTAVNTTCTASLFSPPLTNDRSAAALGALFAGQSGAQGGVAISPDGSNINPAALKLLQFKLPSGGFLIPTPQVIDPSKPFASQGFSTFSEPCTFSENQYMINMDYLVSTKGKISGRFFLVNSDQRVSFPVGTFVGPGNVPGFPSDSVNQPRVFSIAYTYAFNSQLLNEVRFGYTHLLGNLVPTSPYSFSDVGIAEGAQNNGLPTITIQGSLNMGPSGPLEFVQNNYAFEDSVSYVRGRHSMRFGGGYTRLQNDLSNVLTGGNLQFLSFPDFLLGQSAAQNGSGFSNVFASLDAFGLFDRSYRSWESNAYLQDDFKVASRLTVNAGLRYEHIGLYDDTGGRNSNFDAAIANPNPPATGSIDGYVVASNFHGPVPAGVTKSTNPFAVSTNGQNTWGPRLGFAWQVLPQSSRLVLRGGYGIYYSRPTGEAFVQSVFGAPFSVTRINVGSVNANATLANPFAPPPVLPDFPAYSPTSSITAFGDAQEFRPAIVQQYSLNLQTALAKTFLLEVGYVGARSTHLLLQRSADQALSASPENPIRGVTTDTVANVPLREPILGFPPDSMVQVESTGASWYNGLDVSLTKRFSNGLQFLASYTYSKTLDTAGAAVNLSAAGNAIVTGNQNDPGARYGNTDYSRPHRFVFSYVYQFPGHESEAGLMGHLLGGWEMAGVVTIQAGQWITILNTNPNNVFGISEDRAQIAPGCTHYATSGSVQSRLNDFFNTTCFTNPPVIGSDGIGTAFGDSGVGIVPGPDQQNLDLAIIKKTRIGWPGEADNLEFRAEMFNAFNTPQFSNPDNSLSSPTFGQISTTSVNPRIVQFALKFNF